MFVLKQTFIENETSVDKKEKENGSSFSRSLARSVRLNNEQMAVSIVSLLLVQTLQLSRSISDQGAHAYLFSLRFGRGKTNIDRSKVVSEETFVRVSITSSFEQG